ncbi:MAG TPA: methyltransferase domain-containing protein [Acidimicrobiia bacterium]|nr:methyltransferase domain-containing protein [Acidimicrobiia bacterium]
MTRYDSRRYALINRWNPRNFEIIRDWVKPKPGDRVLDVGCGRGHLVNALRSVGVDAEGIDLNPNAAEVAMVPQVKTMSATALNYNDGYFDAIVSFHAIEHIPDVKATLGEMARVVRPGGKVLLIYPAEPVRGLFAVPTAVILHGNPLKARQVHIHKLNPSRVEKLIWGAGLTPLRSQLRLWPSPEYATLSEKPANPGLSAL